MSGPTLNGKPLFSLNRRQVSYQNQVVLDIESLQIQRDEKVALLGASGSGKSTLLRLLYNQRRNDSAWCPQHPGLVPVLSVFHNIYMGRLHRHSAFYNLLNLVRPRSSELDRVHTLCCELELNDKLRTSVDRLSGGQKQRTAVGRALFRQADIFLGDEPVSAVDRNQGKRLLELINRRHGCCVVALHDQAMALSQFDRIVGLKGGRIALDGPASGFSEPDLATLYRC